MARTVRAALVAGTAIPFMLVQASGAQAACVSDGATVTCPDPATGASEVTAALNPPFTTSPDVSLVLPAGSGVVDDGPGAIYMGGESSVSATIDAASTVGVSFFGAANGQTLTGSTVVNDVVDASGATRTSTDTGSGTSTGGAAAASVAGTVTGEFSVSSTNGPASVLLTGQIGGGLAAESRSSERSYQTIETYTGPDLANLSLTASQFSEHTATVGDTATITIASSDAMIAANEAAVLRGEIYASGVAGATVTVSAGSRLFPDAATGGSIWLDNYFYDHTYAESYDFTGAGSGSSTRSEIAFGGPSTFTNAGIIGVGTQSVASGYYDAPTVIDVDSVSHSTLTNSGQIYGDVHLWSVGGTFTETITSTNVNDAANRLDQVTRIYTSDGGMADFVNSGLVTGQATLVSGTGNASNSGVIRGGITLGASVGNYVVETSRTGSDPYAEETITGLVDPFVQTYSLDQSGLLVGGLDGVAVSVSGSVEGSGHPVDPALAGAGTPLLTNSVSANISLADGSVTLGDIVAGHDVTTGARYTTTSVTLDGAGYLGLSGADADRLAEGLAALSPFGAIDPLLTDTAITQALTSAGQFSAGARVLGVDSLTKTGAGTFVFTGSSYLPASGSDDASWTVDAGTLAVQAGELQIDVAPYLRTSGGSYVAAGDPVFGIRGDVTNAASLVLGRRLASAPYGIEGTQLYVLGDFTQTAGGVLTFGTTFVPIAQAGTALAPGSSFVTLDGNLSLGGSVNLLTDPGVLYTNGIIADLFSVNGTVDVTADTLINGLDSPFLDFIFVERQEGGRTIVSVEADHQSYTTGARDINSRTVGEVLDSELDRILGFLNDGSLSGLASTQDAQDLASIMIALDTRTDAEIANAAMQQLSSAEFYGSLIATRTTDPFGDLTRAGLPYGRIGGVNIWFNPAGLFYRNDRNVPYGASPTRTHNYGGSFGIGHTTPGGTNVGAGIGYGRIDVDARGTPEHANANTYMVGAFANGHVAGLNVGGQVVYGWTSWNTSRALPLFDRTATARFDSRELRLLGEVSHAFTLSDITVAPYLRGDFRHYGFDPFTEQGGGAVGVIVAGKSKSLFSPEIGARALTSYHMGSATVSPEVSVSYTLQGDVGASRDMAFIVDPATTFRLVGVDPDAFLSLGGGVSATFAGDNAAYLRASYSTGGDQHGVALNLGVSIGL